MPKLTQKALEALKPADAGAVVRDEGALWGKVRAKGGGVAVSFYYRYRIEGKHKDFSCGTWPAISLAAIRANRDGARQAAKGGKNPSAQKKIEKQQERIDEAKKLAEIDREREDNLTVQDMFEAWLADGVRRNDNNAELNRSFKADVLPKIGTKLVKQISEADLRTVLRSMVARGVNRAAIVMRNDLTQLFKWAEKRQPWRKLLAAGNPMDLIEIEKIVSPGFDLNHVRDRILSEVEIRELYDIFVRMHDVYEAAPNKRVASHPLETTTQLAVWIMLSTLCRVGEMSMARWEDVDLELGEWHVPKANVKGNVADLTIYLSDFAADTFRKLRQITGESDWCFPARNNLGHICVKSISKQIGDRQVMFKHTRDGGPRKPLKHRKNDNSLVLANGKFGAWTPHDLRRTGATLMQKLNVAPDIIDRCQNHALGGNKVRRAYLHYAYNDEKRKAWKRLGDYLSVVLYPPKNVSLHLERA